MATDTPPLIDWRVRQLERELPKKADANDVEKIAEELRGLRKVLIGFMATISGSAILFAFTILQLTAHA